MLSDVNHLETNGVMSEEAFISFARLLQDLTIVFLFTRP